MLNAINVKENVVAKTIIRLCFKHFNKLTRNGREEYFKLEILKQASNIHLESLKDIQKIYECWY